MVVIAEMYMYTKNHINTLLVQVFYTLYMLAMCVRLAHSSKSQIHYFQTLKQAPAFFLLFLKAWGLIFHDIQGHESKFHDNPEYYRTDFIFQDIPQFSGCVRTLCVSQLQGTYMCIWVCDGLSDKILNREREREEI